MDSLDSSTRRGERTFVFLTPKKHIIRHSNVDSPQYKHYSYVNCKSDLFDSDIPRPTLDLGDVRRFEGVTKEHLAVISLDSKGTAQFIINNLFSE